MGQWGSPPSHLGRLIRRFFPGWSTRQYMEVHSQHQYCSLLFCKCLQSDLIFMGSQHLLYLNYRSVIIVSVLSFCALGRHKMEQNPTRRGKRSCLCVTDSQLHTGATPEFISRRRSSSGSIVLPIEFIFLPLAPPLMDFLSHEASTACSKGAIHRS